MFIGPQLDPYVMFFHAMSGRKELCDFEVQDKEKDEFYQNYESTPGWGIRDGGKRSVGYRFSKYPIRSYFHGIKSSLSDIFITDITNIIIAYDTDSLYYTNELYFISGDTTNV